MGTARLEGGAGAAEFFEFLEDLHLGKSVFEGDDALVDESRQILAKRMHAYLFAGFAARYESDAPCLRESTRPRPEC